jgi:hypothetical protein
MAGVAQSGVAAHVWGSTLGSTLCRLLRTALFSVTFKSCITRGPLPSSKEVEVEGPASPTRQEGGHSTTMPQLSR